jgi:hypothetical protein
MVGFLHKILRRETPRVIEHPYFGKLRYFRGRAPQQGHWDGELVIQGLKEKLGVVIPATEAGPTAAQVSFCRAALADLDALFARCRPVFAGEFERWTEKPFPDDWRAEFALCGLDPPVNGDERRPWSVSYFVESAQHYFTAHFEYGKATTLTVDG